MMVQGRSTAGGQPLVIAEPSGAVAAAFMELGSAVVREVSKLQAAPKNSLRSTYFQLFPSSELLQSYLEAVEDYAAIVSCNRLF